MSIKQEFSVKCIEPVNFSPKEELTFEWDIATNFKFVAHRSLMVYKKNQRQGSHNTKTRSEVRGGGKKPWKQKGTGRARAGSNRSPLWRGGGVIFGPKPKTYNLKLNRKEKHITIRTLLHSSRENLIVIENFSCFENLNKTKDFLSIFEKLINSLNQKHLNLETRYLILADENSYISLRRTTKNLKNINLIQQNNLNVPLLCKSDQKIILTRTFLENVK